MIINNSVIKSDPQLYDLLDDRVGIINSIKEYQAPPGSPHFFRYIAQMSNTGAFCDQENYKISIGIASTREHAIAKAIGEGIERYCSAIYFKEDLPFRSYQNAKFNCINPNEFSSYPAYLYRQKEFSWKPFNETTRVRWAPAIDITNSDNLVHVPAAYVYLPYVYGTQEDKIIQSISTGLACHMSHELAAMTAIFEVIERDAFMLFWRNRLAPPKINIHTLPTSIQNIIHEYQLANQEVTLFDITTDIKIPTVLATLRCRLPGNPALVIAASCKLSSVSAIISALEELELTRSHCLKLLANPPSTSNNNLKQFKNQKDHLLFWSQIKNLSLADFLFQSDKEINANQMPNITQSTPKKELQLVTKLLSDMSLTVLLADITTNDVSNYGFHVIRAIIPALHPLAFGYKNDEFKCPRLFSVPKKLGFDEITISNDYIPHPFP